MAGQIHLSGPAGKPKCGRQLSNVRASRAQVVRQPTITSDPAEYMKALLDGKACRHCGRAAGIILPEVVRYENAETEDGLED